MEKLLGRTIAFQRGNRVAEPPVKRSDVAQHLGSFTHGKRFLFGADTFIYLQRAIVLADALIKDREVRICQLPLRPIPMLVG